ncbi:unnamed protein product [Discosporangium mesarthrocarpum]
MVRETAMDLGINAYRLDQNEAPPLYPPLDLPPPARIMEKDVALVAKQRELVADSINSPYFIAPKHVVTNDVERYTDGFRASGAAQSLSMDRVLTPSIVEVLPAELVNLPSGCSAGAVQAGVQRKKLFDVKSLTALEDKEKLNAEDGDRDKEKDGMQSDGEMEIEEEEDQEEEDYLRNHYDSNVESDGDDDGAVF